MKYVEIAKFDVIQSSLVLMVVLANNEVILLFDCEHVVIVAKDLRECGDSNLAKTLDQPGDHCPCWTTMYSSEAMIKIGSVNRNRSAGRSPPQ